MPTKKIADYPTHPGWTKSKEEKKCLHPEHEPPRHMVWPPGIYEHTCPACGRVTQFTVPPTFFVGE